MLAGEIHNSSSSSLEYMKKEVWEKIRASFKYTDRSDNLGNGGTGRR